MILSKSTKQILLEHYHKYPEMEAIDYVKLIYQNVFGCGHVLLTEKSYDYLLEEYNLFPHNYNETNYVDIGNGYYRVELNHTNLKVDEIFNLLKESTKKNNGSQKQFLRKIRLLKSLVKNNKIPIKYEEIDKEIKLLKGFPSHSEKYHKLYSPHYRVIKKSLIKQ